MEAAGEGAGCFRLVGTSVAIGDNGDAFVFWLELANVRPLRAEGRLRDNVVDCFEEDATVVASVSLSPLCERGSEKSGILTHRQ